MRPLRIIIPGEFWDSQIYMGRLHLWTRSGSLRTYNWELLASSIIPDSYARLAFTCAFIRGDYLYQTPPAVFSDSDVADLLKQKFASAAAQSYEPSADAFERSLIREQNSPFPFPHNDVTIYIQQMYSASREGIWRAACNSKNAYPVSRKSTQLWDGCAMSVSASYGALAIAAGGDGLFELPSTTNYQFDEEDDPRCIVDKHASSCEWNYWSLYAASHISGGYLAGFSRLPARSAYRDGEDESRRFEELVPGERIFAGMSPYSWGGRDKIYSVTDRTIHARKYQPWEEHRIQSLSDVQRPEIVTTDSVIGAKTATFGIVVELAESLLVIESSGDVHAEPVPINWRIYPRSLRYENHLHLIHEDRLEILSFNTDFFVEQDSKILGSLPTTPATARAR